MAPVGLLLALLFTFTEVSDSHKTHPSPLTTLSSRYIRWPAMAGWWIRRPGMPCGVSVSQILSITMTTKCSVAGSEVTLTNTHPLPSSNCHANRPHSLFSGYTQLCIHPKLRANAASAVILGWNPLRANTNRAEFTPPDLRDVVTHRVRSLTLK